MHSKLLCFLGFMWVICCNNPVAGSLSDGVVNLLEEFRVRMCHPFPQWNLPALDPYEIKHEEIFINNDVFKNFSGAVTDLRATGLSDFIINEVKITTLMQKFKFNLTFPLNELQSQYIAIGTIGNIVKLVGNETMNGNLKEVRIVATGGIKLGFTFGIKNLNIKIEIGDLYVDMGKLLEQERMNNFFHNVVNDLTIELFGDFWEDFGEPLTKKLENIINKKMSSFTLKDVIGMITGSGEPIFGDNPPGDCKTQVEVSTTL